MKIGIKEFRRSVKAFVPHDDYYIEKLTMKDDGCKGFRLTLYKVKHSLHLLGITNMGLEKIFDKSYYEPSYRHVIMYMDKNSS